MGVLANVYCTQVFLCFFLSCKANARVKLAKMGHGPHSTTLVVFVLFGCYLCCSMYCLCVNVYCHRVTTQLQLRNISYYIKPEDKLGGITRDVRTGVAKTNDVDGGIFEHLLRTATNLSFRH